MALAEGAIRYADSAQSSLDDKAGFRTHAATSYTDDRHDGVGSIVGGWPPLHVHYTPSMPSLREHLDSPQFTDKDGESLGESVVGRVGGTWVKQGEPRWKAYLFYLISLVGGIGLIVTSGDGFDLFAMFGVACVALGIFGGIETIRGRPFTRIFGGPAKSE